MKHYSLFGTMSQALGHAADHNPTLRLTCMLGRPSPDRQAQRQGWWRGLVLGLLFPLAMGGCYWLKYGKLMCTHIDLLVSMAKKMSDLLEVHETISMEEFTYPLDRARDFVRIVSSRYAERRSLRAFTHFLDLYAELLREADRLRGQSEDISGFRERIAALQQEAEKVKAILTEEGL